MQTPRRRPARLALACLLAMATTQSLHATDTDTAALHASLSLDSPAGPLGPALTRLAARAGIALTFDPSLTHGRQAPALRGPYSLEAALDQLLVPNGLRWRARGPGAIVVEPAPRESGTVTTGALSVQGAADTGTGGADGPYRAPASVARVSAAQIQRHRGTNVGDIVAGIPGVLSGENRNSGGLDLNIRGMQGMNRIPVVVDGAQQSSVVYRGYSGVASRNYLDPDLLGEMEIEKGPSTRPEAVGATGGIMVARTLAVDDILSPGDTFGIRLRGELRGNTASAPPAGTKGGLQTNALAPNLHGAGDSRGWIRGCEAAMPGFCDNVPVNGNPIPDAAYAQPAPNGERPATLRPTDGGGSIVMAKRWDHIDLLAAYARRRAGNYFAGTHGNAGAVVETLSPWTVAGGTVHFESLGLDGDTRFRAGEQVVNSGYDNTSYLLKGTGRWGEGQSLELGLNRFDSDYGDMMPSEIVRGEGFTQGLPSNVVVDTVTARYRFNPGDNDWLDLRVNAWNKDITLERNLYYGLMQWMADMMGTGATFIPARAEYSERTGVDVDNTSTFDGRWGALQLRYGASMTKETLTSEPFPELASGEYTLDPTADRHDGKRDEQSAFVSARWTPMTWLQVDAAWRHTRSDSYDRNPVRVNLGRNPETGLVESVWRHNQQRNSGSAPVLALTFKPVEGVQLYLRHAEAIRTPSLFESTSGFSASPNPLLSITPERMRSREAGLNVERFGLFGDDVLRLHVAYFDNRVDDYIYRAIGGSANLESATFKGAELTAEYDRGRVYGALGLMHYREIDYCEYTPDTPPRNFVKCHPDGIGFSDTQIPPKQSASVSLGSRWLGERLDVGIRGIYNSRRPDMTFVGSGRVNVRWSPHTVWDLYSSYQVNDRLSVDFNLDNAGDKYYADPLLIGITAAPGRTFRLGFTYDF